MTLSQTVVWDDVRDTVELTMVGEGDDLPNPPNIPTGATWYGASPLTVTMSAPVRKATVATRTGIYSTLGPNNIVRWWKITWNAQTSTWSAPVAVDINGNPI